MSYYFLWTDKCFLVLLAIAVLFLIRSLRNEPTRRAYAYLFSQPIAMSAAIIMGFFLVIAVLDSIHTVNKNDNEVIQQSFTSSDSLLDQMLEPLNTMHENTYSAPLALSLYSLETVFKHGVVTKVYPRLQYPSKNIHTDKQRSQLMIQLILKALGFSLCITILIGGLFFCCQRFFRKRTTAFINKASLAAYITLFLCLLLTFVCYEISRHFHLLGTGKIGEDIFYYTVKSIRTGLIIGTLTTLFMLPLALILGIMSGYFGGIVDDIIQYVYITLSSIPGVLLITASVLSIQTYIANHPEEFKTLAESADARLLALCLILGVTSWTSLCRLLRAEALKFKQMDFVLVAQALGSSSLKIIWKHLLPNVMHIVVITLVLDFSFLVLAEAVLSYVGVGVSPMTMSWGNMINTARLELAREPIVWWPISAAFLFMFILVLASNLLADAMRDAFDPRQRA